jgi:hypothetical protein
MQPWVMSVVANQTTGRKHGILSVICSLPHTMMYRCFPTLSPHPPHPPHIPARMCKKMLINILKIMNDERNKKQHIGIMFVIMFVNSSYKKSNLC